jgi:hypothetical protein
MFATIRLIRLFVKSLARTAAALEEIRDLYELDLESRGIRRITATGSAINERVEVMYGSTED